jgi:hypothetical protein
VAKLTVDEIARFRLYVGRVCAPPTMLSEIAPDLDSGDRHLAGVGSDTCCCALTVRRRD